jgi:histidyl-tRNA synthetase
MTIEDMSIPHALTPSTFVPRASQVAEFYGFRPAREFGRSVQSFTGVLESCTARLGTKPGNPVLAYWATPSPTHLPTGLSPREVGEFGLQIIGSDESISDVLLVKTVHAILAEWGGKVARIRINALGDRESRARFERELGWHLRKRTGQLCTDCQTRVAGNLLLAIYQCVGDSCRASLLEGPRAVNFLSERSRTHFRAVLEHLEALSLPYELDDLLMSNEVEARITFTVDLEDSGGILLAARGGRYDDHIRTLTSRKDATGTSASILFSRRGTDRTAFTIPVRGVLPQLYFIQLGSRAKLRGLLVLDALRQAHVPVGQLFNAKGLGPQMQSARELNVPYLIIMGEREALDGTVIVRKVSNNAQTTVALPGLPRYLKALHV